MKLHLSRRDKIVLALTVVVVALIFAIGQVRSASADSTQATQPPATPYLEVGSYVDDWSEAYPTLVRRVVTPERVAYFNMGSWRVCPSFIGQESMVFPRDTNKWHGQWEGTSLFLVFHSDTPTRLTVPYGVLTTNSSSYIRGQTTPQVTDARWQCVSPYTRGLATKPAAEPSYDFPISNWEAAFSTGGLPAYWRVLDADRLEYNGPTEDLYQLDNATITNNEGKLYFGLKALVNHVYLVRR